ncbi:hypothetical protein M413DRAFT_240813 [Hebeloma cylindrosporum]|uniref:Uncharacterized protein n=1 Tax=Hebeloma cylindrosporum TaxID=76867 RepID=A0A0C3C385_HEBCY|nr:hypothetical protein M413DRAFT_240813 [Hebeloma cylindrosporum h7]
MSGMRFNICILITCRKKGLPDSRDDFESTVLNANFLCHVIVLASIVRLAESKDVPPPEFDFAFCSIPICFGAMVLGVTLVYLTERAPNPRYWGFLVPCYYFQVFLGVFLADVSLALRILSNLQEWKTM